MENIKFKEKIERINFSRKFELDGRAIYLDPEYPHWMVVNRAGDEFLSKILSSREEIARGGSVQSIFKNAKFINLIPSYPNKEYEGRASYLSISHMDELWLHITDNCNLKCSHCLFSCEPGKKRSLSFEDIRKTVIEAYQLGVRIFYLTGGEPFVHPEIKEIMDFIVNSFEDTNLVLMTNGVLLPSFEEFLKKFPEERLFFQVSVDGDRERHEDIRGKGSYDKLLKGLESLSLLGFKNTISMSVHIHNLSCMKSVIDLASEYNFSSVHYMWLILKGKAGENDYVAPEVVFDNLVDAAFHADKKGVEIDNIKSMEALVFSPPGTRYDLGTSGWRSIAVGPDKNIYPTAAMISDKNLVCGSIDDGIENIWKNSNLFEKIRSATIKDTEYFSNSPFKFLTGGGDMDLSYYNGGKFAGEDPYLPLYEKLILWIISKSSANMEEGLYPSILIKMGDKISSCHSDGNGVSLTHSNCVLTFSNTRKVVGDFYSNADSSGNEDILNPVCYPENEISHIPSHGRFKSYGCGSPVLDSDIREGEVIVDLGSGAGVECFIASRKTGKNGYVYGVDMLDHMLEKARSIHEDVAENLGFNNVEFKKGFLEEIPLPDETADLVVSNCVINLSEDKRKTLKEIIRVLKPGGRLVVSDVVTDKISPPYIQNDEKLQGECIAGAMVQRDLFSMLEGLGFKDIFMKKRFFYREVKGHIFYSLTYEAYKPSLKKDVDLLYPGPYAAVITDKGDLLIRGEKYHMEEPFYKDEKLHNILILDSRGNASNIEAKNSCCCFTPEQDIKENEGLKILNPISLSKEVKHSRNCMVCGEELVYSGIDSIKKCFYCSKEIYSSSQCMNGHFVCDECHGEDAFSFVREMLLHTDEKDLVSLMNKIRMHPSFNLHGPEHHYTIPGVILAVYRNMGGSVKEDDIDTALQRGKSIPGGVCAFWGGCGAPLGVGAGFGVILESNPLKADSRQRVQMVVGEIINRISRVKGPRCCQRECWTSLIAASELSEEYLQVKLPAEGGRICDQYDENSECIRGACPFYEK